jgi:MYXO-CTERM domain-containing protein
MRDMSAASARVSSASFQYAWAGMSAFFAASFAWLAWTGEGSDSTWRYCLAVGWLGLALVWLRRGRRITRSRRADEGRDAQEVGSRPSTTFWWLHWTLTALAALSFAIGLFHLGSDAFWYFSASMVLATAVATANLVRLWLAQRRNRPAQTYAGAITGGKRPG